MRDMQIDVRGLTARARRWVRKRVATGEINLGFITFAMESNDPERTAARKLVIQLRDKRVFHSNDCCDGCVKNSMESLQQVREILVKSQVDLADLHDGQLFWLTDYILVTIKAFLTWEERSRVGQPHGRDPEHHYRDHDHTQQYIRQLDVVRAHSRVAIAAIAALAEMDLDGLPGEQMQKALSLTAEPKYLLTEPSK